MNAIRWSKPAVFCACLLALAGFAWAQDEPGPESGGEKPRKEEMQKRARTDAPETDKTRRDRADREIPQGPLGGALRRADENKDGVLSREEFNAAMRQVFDGADRDTNGTLDRRELRQLRRSFAPPQAGPEGRTGMRMRGEGRRPFDEEGPPPMRWEEAPRWGEGDRSMGREQGPGMGREQGPGMGRGPQSPERPQSPQALEEHLKRIEEHWKSFDADKDGRIAKDEWKGAPRRFQRLDADGDGAVTEKEIQEALRKIRETAQERRPRERGSQERGPQDQGPRERGPREQAPPEQTPREPD